MPAAEVQTQGAEVQGLCLEIAPRVEGIEVRGGLKQDLQEQHPILGFLNISGTVPMIYIKP